MNKKQLQKVINLFRNGVSEPICVATLIELMPRSSTSLDKGIVIHSFYEKVFELDIKQETLK